ncbi:MAG: hypothetical protein B7Y84_02940 [Azorhizobium sp. 32-67-21]|nr:MAG: hypothetical protein B7Y84_02940 [Azorhizobium sp. 32-67-21]
MDYLGGLRGTGVLLCGNASVTPMQYDFDGYLSNSGEVTSCGASLRMARSAARDRRRAAPVALDTHGCGTGTGTGTGLRRRTAVPPPGHGRA